MAGRTRSTLLQTTARLLQHRGYHGTSLSDILAKSGSPRGSLYFHFPGGKDQLVLEATKASVQQTTQELRSALERASNPARGVREFVEAAAGILRETAYTFGCPVAPVILDAAGGAPELAELCRQALDEWTGLLKDAFIRAGATPGRAGPMALIVMATIEGLLLMARARQDSRPLLEVAAPLEAIVQGILPRRATGPSSGPAPGRGRRERHRTLAGRGRKPRP